MSNGFRASLINEIIKLAKNKINYLYVIVVGGIIIASACGMEIVGISNNPNGGYLHLLFSLQTLASMVLPILLLLFASNIVSSEVSIGTIRNILVSNSSRKHFLISKIITSFVFQIILMVIATIIAIVIGYFFFGFGDLIEDGFKIMSWQQFWIQFIFAYILLAIVLFAAVSFGILASVIAMNNIAAVTLAMGSYILIEAVKAKLHIENFIYSTYIEFPLGILGESAEGFSISWTPKVYQCLVVSISWIVLSLLISYLVIRKREFK